MATCPVPGVGRSLRIDSDRCVIEWKSRTILAFPVRLEAIDIDKLPVLQLELDQVNVYGMGVFGQVLDIPRLGRAHPGDLRDILIKMASVDEDSNRVSGNWVLCFI